MKIYIAGVFILIDIVTGLTLALHNKELDSSVMREGLFNKGAEVMSIFLTWTIEYFLGDSGIVQYLPVCGAMCIYISVMEIISAIENICALNPALRRVFGPYLKKLNNWKKGEE